MTKPTKWVCTQRRLRSAWASAQSDQSSLSTWRNPSLIRVFTVRMKKPWALSYPLSAQRRLWSDWADAQADLSFRWTHSHIVGFVTRRLSWYAWLKCSENFNGWNESCCCVGSFMALWHFSGHFGCGQLTYPHCSWASLLGSLPVVSAHSFDSNWQLPFLNQQKGENGHRNYFMTNLLEKNVAGLEDGTRDRPHTRRMRIRLSYCARLWNASKNVRNASFYTRILESQS